MISVSGFASFFIIDLDRFWHYSPPMRSFCQASLRLNRVLKHYNNYSTQFSPKDLSQACSYSLKWIILSDLSRLAIIRMVVKSSAFPTAPISLTFIFLFVPWWSLKTYYNRRLHIARWVRFFPATNVHCFCMRWHIFQKVFFFLLKWLCSCVLLF